MFFATIYDISFSNWVQQHNFKEFNNFMSDSIFEGGMFGAGDLTVVTAIFCLIFYLLAWHYEQKSRLPSYRPPEKTCVLPKSFLPPTKLISLRPYLGFILLNSLCVSVLAVHTLKWISARPRPWLVAQEVLPFSEWYEIGGHFITEGSYHGSFPSGHVATSVALFGVAYCLMHACKNKVKRNISILFFLFAIILSLLMAFSRIMIVSHWPTDVVFSYFGGLALTHILFFWGYRVPERIEKQKVGIVSQDKPYVELRMGSTIFIGCLGLMCLFIGLRAFMMLHELWLLLIVLGGFVICLFSVLFSLKLGLFRPVS